MKLRIQLLLICLIMALAMHGCQAKAEAQSYFKEDVYIPSIDTKLYAELRGYENQENPILLYLHGGPGSPLGIPIFKAYSGHELEQNFILVYLHQRGIMKSPRVADSTHTITNYISDVAQVVNYLKKRFEGRDIYILGHSWGGLLGYLYLLEFPDEVKKFVAVSAPVDVISMTYKRIEMLINWAEETNNLEALNQLKPLRDLSITEDPRAFDIMKPWMGQAYGGWHRKLSMERVNKSIDYEDEINPWLKEQLHIEELMLKSLLSINLDTSLQYVKIPLLCIAGKEDANVPYELIKQSFNLYGGEKYFVLFEHSHHMPFIDEEALFVREVKGFLRNEY